MISFEFFSGTDTRSCEGSPGTKMEGTFILETYTSVFYDEICIFIPKYILSQMDSSMWMKNYSFSKSSLRDKNCDTQDLEHSSNRIVCKSPQHLEGHSGNFLCKIKSKTKFI